MFAPLCWDGIEPQAYIADVIYKIARDWPAGQWMSSYRGIGSQSSKRPPLKPPKPQSPDHAYQLTGYPIDDRVAVGRQVPLESDRDRHRVALAKGDGAAVPADQRRSTVNE